MPVPLCFFCGGNARYNCLIYPPRPIAEHDGDICDNCRDCREDDEIIVFEVIEKDPGCANPKLTDTVWYTGRWVNVPRDLCLRWFPPAAQPKIIEDCAAFISSENFLKVHLDRFQKGVQQ